MSLTPAHLIFGRGNNTTHSKNMKRRIENKRKKCGRETNGTLWKKQNGASVCLFLTTQ